MASGTIKAVASKSDTDAILGTGKTWINNAELNDYKTTGLYYIGSGAKVGGTATSLFNYSVLMVYAGKTDRTVQIAYINGGTDIVSRQWNVDTWTTWKHYSEVKVNLTENLSSFTGASLVQYVKDSGKSIHITSTSGTNRVSDLPVFQAGTYIIMPGSYYADIFFFGTNGLIYFHKNDDNTWVKCIDDRSSSFTSTTYDSNKLVSVSGVKKGNVCTVIATIKSGLTVGWYNGTTTGIPSEFCPVSLVYGSHRINSSADESKHAFAQLDTGGTISFYCGGGFSADIPFSFTYVV